MIESSHSFKPHQVVYLSSAQAYLYGEVIQVVTSRQLCWFRPWLLTLPGDRSTGDRQVVDLRFTADLLWPIKLFQPALDAEVLPWLAQLNPSNVNPEANQQARKQLHCFIEQVWLAHRNC